MNNKKCIKCFNTNVTKKGKQFGIQRWWCKDCKLKFQANRKPLPDKEEVFYSFSFGKQTLNELNAVYHVGNGQLQKLLDEYILKEKIHTPRKIYIVVDGIYFGERDDPNRFCLIVFRDPKEKENLWWKFCDTEKFVYYLEGKQKLQELGYEIKGVTGDGLSLIRQAFKGIPFQMCLVHMRRIVVRGTTNNPVLEASMALLAITKTLFYTKKDLFKQRMQNYTDKYLKFVNEKATSELSGKSWYVHEELRKAYYSLLHLFPFLFTFKSDSNISKTTNSLEGHFRQIRTKVNNHPGLTKQRKQKLIEIMLLNSSASLHYKKKRK